MTVENTDDTTLKKTLSSIECRILSLISSTNDAISQSDESLLRWAFSLARITTVGKKENDKISHIALNQANNAYRRKLLQLLSPFLFENEAIDLDGIKATTPKIKTLLVNERKELLDIFQNQFAPKDLDQATRKRPLALALSGGGGSAYVFVGVFSELEEAGIIPDGMAATSMGAILGAYRARKKHFELGELKNLVAPLVWTHLLQKNTEGNRFGVPAAFRLYLREIIGHEFETDQGFMRLNDLAIPLRITLAGISNFSSDLEHSYEELAQAVNEDDSNLTLPIRKNIISDLVAAAKNPLKAVYLGGDPLTKTFDVLDAIGFSSAVPGLIHYDLFRNDERMTKLLQNLVEAHQVRRFIDGGLADNLPSSQASACVQENDSLLEKDPFTVALDSFSPNFGRYMLFLPLMKMAAKTSAAGYKDADLAIAFKNIISPVSIVPTPEELMQAVAFGKESTLSLFEK